MRSLSGIGLGISLVFGCLLLALIVELYYMLCWKKRSAFLRQQEDVVDDVENGDEDKLGNGNSSAREFLYMLCCKKVSFLSSCGSLNPKQICASVRTKQQLSSGDRENRLLKGEAGFLCPPRYLFTIVEETMEDLVSDDETDDNGGKIVKRRQGSTSLNELLMLSVEEIHTPYLTPLASPQFMTSPALHGFNPFLESSSDAEISKIKASPPPKFKFLQVAEEKFNKRNMMEQEQVDVGHSKAPDFNQDSFITIVIGDHRNSSQVSSQSQV